MPLSLCSSRVPGPPSLPPSLPLSLSPSLSFAVLPACSFADPMFSEARNNGGNSSHLPPVPCKYNRNVLCGLEGYVKDLINFGANATNGQVSPAIWLGNCMDCLHVSPTLANCTPSPNGTLNGKGWDRQGLRRFLRFLDTQHVRSVDIWTSGAAPQRAKYCPWEFEELERWMSRGRAGTMKTDDSTAASSTDDEKKTRLQPKTQAAFFMLPPFATAVLYLKSDDDALHSAAATHGRPRRLQPRPPVKVGTGGARRQNAASGFSTFPGAPGVIVGHDNGTVQLSTESGKHWSTLPGVSEKLLCQQAPGGAAVGRCLGLFTALPLLGNASGGSSGLTLTSVGAVPDFYVYWQGKLPRDNFIQSTVYTVTLDADRRSLKLRDVAGAPIAYRGLPWPVYQFMSTSGTVFARADGSVMQSVIVWYDKNQSGSGGSASGGGGRRVGSGTGRSPWPGPCCNNSIAMFEWVPRGREFRFLSTAVSSETVHDLGYEEGACENSVVLLGDQKTLLMVLRVDGGDGEPLGRHSNFLATQSTTDGRHWEALWPIPAGSARPRLAILESGALLLSGGRPGLGLWVDATGRGRHWEAYSVPQLHNQGASSSERFCEAFANHSLAKDTLGWAESTGYTSLLPLGGETALLCYDRTGGGSGGYPAPPRACRPQHASCAPEKAKDCWSDLYAARADHADPGQ